MARSVGALEGEETATVTMYYAIRRGFVRILPNRCPYCTMAEEDEEVECNRG